MKKILFIVLILLIPVCAAAEYKIYLKNGSVISEVRSYEEMNGDVIVYFGTGSMTISQKDILKIGGTEPAEKETQKTDVTDIQQRQERTERAPDQSQPRNQSQEQPRTQSQEQPRTQETGNDKSNKIDALRTELQSVISEIKAAEEQEAGLVTTINQKTGRRFSYNQIQIKQLEKEVEPLKQQLYAVQQKKAELVQRKSSIESELRLLE
jgi:outer membrane murein-binding lipoprotein Lpp